MRRVANDDAEDDDDGGDAAADDEEDDDDDDDGDDDGDDDIVTTTRCRVPLRALCLQQGGTLNSVSALAPAQGSRVKLHK